MEEGGSKGEGKEQSRGRLRDLGDTNGAALVDVGGVHEEIVGKIEGAGVDAVGAGEGGGAGPVKNAEDIAILESEAVGVSEQDGGPAGDGDSCR